MPLVTSIDLGQTHKEKIKSLSFNKSIGISLLIHNVFSILFKKDDKRPVTVEYAADLSTSIYGSGFPKHKISNWLDADF